LLIIPNFIKFQIKIKEKKKMDNQEFDDELITQFCDIADTTPDVAKNYLSV